MCLVGHLLLSHLQEHLYSRHEVGHLCKGASGNKAGDHLTDGVKVVERFENCVQAGLPDIDLLVDSLL